MRRTVLQQITWRSVFLMRGLMEREEHASLTSNMPVFKMKDSSVRRRYSDFKWLRDEVSRTVQIVMPSLPGKAFTKQLPFISSDDGIFEPEFIEERRLGLEEFLNKVAGHPLVQGERCLHMFLTEQFLDKASYVPGKVV